MDVEEAGITENERAVISGGETAEPFQIDQAREGSLAYSLVQKVMALPPDKQQEVLDFAEFLVRRIQPKPPRRSLKGLWADLGISITAEDIAEARREMWSNFPRDDI